VPAPIRAETPVGNARSGTLSISGAPPTAVAASVAYSFIPTASDLRGASLSFSIANKPSWASFSAATGMLRGTPGVGDVGAYRNITIRVSDSTTQVSLPPFSVEVVAMATGSVTVNWLAPEEQTDGSPLTDLSGYKIYWGTSPGDYPNSWRVNHPGVVTYVIENLTPGTYYLVATAFDSDGVESEYSDIVSEVVR